MAQALAGPAAAKAALPPPPSQTTGHNMERFIVATRPPTLPRLRGRGGAAGPLRAIRGPPLRGRVLHAVRSPPCPSAVTSTPKTPTREFSPGGPGRSEGRRPATSQVVCRTFPVAGHRPTAGPGFSPARNGLSAV